MKHSPLCPSRHRLAAAAFGLALLAAPAANAFTFENQGDADTSRARGFNDMDKRVAPGSGIPDTRFDKGEPTALQRDNFSLQFGPQRSIENRYNTDNLFDPLGRPAGR